MSNLAALVRALPPTPFRAQGTPQLADALEAIVRRSSPSEARAAAAAAAIERLQAGRALAEFPLSDRTLRPAHDVHLYDRTREGVHRSAKGIGRSWWKRFFQVKGQV
ncbi:hypothetical protein Q5752_004184 [Cryptotrichosporon argae]